jgi:hypothetical protein
MMKVIRQKNKANQVISPLLLIDLLGNQAVNDWHILLLCADVSSC